MQTPKPFIKVGITMAAAGAMRGYTMRYATGNPGATAAPSPGVNGAAVVNGAGTMPRTNPVAPNEAYLARFGIQASRAGVFWLIDRLWENSGLSTTLTTAQAITPVAIPARDGDGTANGNQIMAGIEWSTTGGAGTPTVSLTYTNQAGTVGRVGTLTAVTTPPVGTFEIFTFDVGDVGIRAPTSFIQTATRTSGAFHLILFRVLAQVEVSADNIGNAIDALTGGRPRIFDGSTMQMIWFPSSTAAANFVGQYIETHVNPA
ncbi:MAG: hypothetical protein ACRCZI_03155 [Cetobacterium sp.]